MTETQREQGKMYIVNAKKEHVFPFFKSDSKPEHVMALLRKVPQKCYFCLFVSFLYSIYLSAMLKCVVSLLWLRFPMCLT